MSSLRTNEVLSLEKVRYLRRITRRLKSKFSTFSYVNIRKKRLARKGISSREVELFCQGYDIVLDESERRYTLYLIRV